MNLKKFTSFDHMITPTIIKILFWIGIGVVALASIISLFTGVIGGIASRSFGRVFLALIAAPIGFILGALMVRIYAELLIIIFSINDHLKDIKDLLSQGRTPKHQQELTQEE